jgi:hypothetical protein
VTGDLVQRIKAALGGAEKLASAATPGPWYPEPCGDYGSYSWLIAPVLREKYGDNALDFGEDERTARYVAAWSPDRALALIESDRALLDYAVELGGVRGDASEISRGLLTLLAARWGVTP